MEVPAAVSPTAANLPPNKKIQENDVAQQPLNPPEISKATERNHPEASKNATQRRSGRLRKAKQFGADMVVDMVGDVSMPN